MKLTIEITEESIQQELERIVKRGSGCYQVQSIISKSIQTALEDKIKADFKQVLSPIVDNFIHEELVKACEQKVPGWVKRRVKEMLEVVRKSDVIGE